MVMGTCSGIALIPPFVQILERLEFHNIVSMDDSGWPECLPWLVAGSFWGSCWRSVG